MTTTLQHAQQGTGVRGRGRLPAGILGILGANVVLIFIGTLVLGVDLFSRASLSTLTPMIGIMALAALGQAFIIGTGGIDLSIPATVTLVGVMILKLTEGAPGQMVIAIPVILVVCVLIGAVNGFLVEVVGLDSLIVTLATSLLVVGITQLYRGPVLAVSAVPSDLAELAGGSIGQIGIALFAAIVVATVIALFLRFHTSSRRLTASSTSRVAAAMTGLPAVRFRLTAWMLSSVIVGVAAIMLAGRIRTPDAAMGDPYLLTPIVAVVLGGASLAGGRVRPWSTVLGAAFLVVLDHVLRTLGYSSGVSLAFQGVVLGVGLALVAGSKVFRFPLRGLNRSAATSAA